MKETVLITIAVHPSKREQYHKAAQMAGKSVSSICIDALEKILSKFGTKSAPSEGVPQ